ncbi:hypothetical protein DV736_g4403, partial [Chaetothyriales sp. CBS 134916]
MERLPQDEALLENDDDVLPEKNANLIMCTNNSSIVSKRSVERLYLPKPHFFRHFVKKSQRRSPTINRGYWLRMRAVNWVVRMFLERVSTQNKVIINLGCGYDPIPFQWLTNEPAICKNVKFIDVDYDALMESKRDIVINTPELSNLFTVRDPPRPRSGILYHSDQYSILGCDLKNLKRLKDLVTAVVDVDQCVVLCVAEVSITYMATPDADAVLSWYVTFCLLEQLSPDEFDNPFTATMLKHFEKLGTPLRNLQTYPGENSLTQRFTTAGYTEIEVFSLWELWADSRFLSPSQRMALDHVEPFDEWEEFALFASHYGLSVAQTGSEPLVPPPPLERRDSEISNLSEVSARTASPYRADLEWFAYKYTENPNREGRTHHGSAYLNPESDVILLHGGASPSGRHNSTFVYAPVGEDNIHPVMPPIEIPPRSCHTVSTLLNRQNILIGGRASPSVPFRDCWLQTGDKWERVHDLPEPRYRHRAVAIILPDGSHGVLVFGGKVSATKVADDFLLWVPRVGWQRLRSLGQDPMPRFGASFIRLGYNHGIMLGGMRQDGIICQGLWRWRLIVRDNVVEGLQFRASAALDASVGMYPWLSRLGASYSLIRNECLIIGGIGRLGCIPKIYEVMSLLGSFSAFGDSDKEMDLRVMCVKPRLPPGCPRPFLVGHSTHRTVSETSLILGGGSTCFSFGSYWNSGAWTLYFREQGIMAPWALVKPKPVTPRKSRCQPIVSVIGGGLYAPAEPVQVSRVPVTTAEDLTSLIIKSQPALIPHLAIGPCTHAWTPDYLRSKTSPRRNVVVHSAPTPIMNFTRRSTFSYNTLPFHTFLALITSTSRDLQVSPHMYLRSISSSPRTTVSKLSTDWPELAPDFVLPPQLDYISARLHSSPLRISTNVSMWLHYDVMANILFHISSYPIQAPKELILFPPEDLKYLSFATGSTTSTLDIFQELSNSSTSEPIYPPNTHPHLVSLYPGEVLFIPPLWAHTAGASPAGVVNISVNIFFRSLHDGAYPAGRDVYGNRDLMAYEEGRRDLDKMVKRFKVIKEREPDGPKTERTKQQKDENGENQDSPSPSPGQEADEKEEAPLTRQITCTRIKPPAGQCLNEAEEKGMSTSSNCPAPDAIPGVTRAIAKAYLERLASELLERAAAL